MHKHLSILKKAKAAGLLARIGHTGRTSLSDPERCQFFRDSLDLDRVDFDEIPLRQPALQGGRIAELVHTVIDVQGVDEVLDDAQLARSGLPAGGAFQGHATIVVL